MRVEVGSVVVGVVVVEEVEVVVVVLLLCGDVMMDGCGGQLEYVEWLWLL